MSKSGLEVAASLPVAMAVPDHVEHSTGNVIMAQQANSLSAQESKPEKLTEFLDELSELSAKYGIGITGDPVLFIMEKDDFAFSYRADAESNLTLG
jgi:hypothetical protein